MLIVFLGVQAQVDKYTKQCLYNRCLGMLFKLKDKDSLTCLLHSPIKPVLQSSKCVTCTLW